MATDTITIYCLRCRDHTENIRPPELVTPDSGRATLRAQCAKCGGNKSRFASTPKQTTADPDR